MRGLRAYRGWGAGSCGDPCPRRARAAQGRGGGPPPARSTELRHRRPRRPGVPGGQAPGTERSRLGLARVAAQPADHRQPRPRGAAEGGLGVRPPDLARRARRDATAPTGAPRRARCGRRARARWPGPARGRRTRRRGRSTSCRPGPGRVCRRVGGGGRPRRCGADPGQASRGGGRLLPRRDRRPVVRAAHRLRARARRDPGPVGRPRPGAGSTCARDRGRGRAQPPPLRASGHGQDDARPPAARRAASSDPPGGARGDADPLGGRTASARKAAPDRSALPSAAPRCLRPGDRRGRTQPEARRGVARAPGRAAPRRAPGVHALGAGGPPPAPRGRRGRGRARRWPRALPGPVPARGDDEHVPLRRPGRSGGRMRLHAPAPGRVPREAVPRAARPVRSRGGDAAAPCGRAGRSARRGFGRGTCPRQRRPGTTPGRPALPHRGCVGAPVERRRATAALGA